MTFTRFLRVGLPLLLLGLLWLNLRPAAPSPFRAQPPAQRVQLPTPASAIDPVSDFGKWTDSYLTSPNPAAIEVGVALAKDRRQSLKQLIQSDPARALQLAISDEIRNRLPAEVVAELETRISAAGEFEMIATCYTGGFRAPAGAPEIERFVTIDTQRYRAFTFGRRAEMQTKDRLSLHGIAIDDVLALHPDPIRKRSNLTVEVFGKERRFADEDDMNYFIAALIAYEDAAGSGSGDDDSGLPVANSAWTEGTKRILYLRVRFADQDPAYEPISLATAQSQQADVEEHFRVSSYGKMTVTTVFPDTITLPQNKSAYVGQGLGLMMNDARALAITMGQAEGEDWNYSNYDFYTIISDGGIGSYAGVAQVGGRKSHLQRGYTSLRTAGHEFGHNFGLSHAYYNYTSDLSPRGSTPVDGINRVEYGHRFSVMSAQSGSDFDHPLIPHFTPYEKWRLNWLTDADFTDITTGNQSGTFRLYQYDLENAANTRALRVPSGGALSKYWLSYRTAWRTPNRTSDNDYLLNGIVFDWTGNGGGTSTLLDMTPYSDDGSHSGADWTRDNADKWDAPLLIGRTYTDPDSLVSVTPVARGGSAPNEYLDVYVHVGTGMEVPLVAETDACRAIIPTAATAAGTAWTANVFNDSAWPFSGILGVGYDENDDFLPYFNTDVESAMNNQNSTCYIRVPFTIGGAANLANIASLNLRMRYDDGFVAYINGVKVAEANAPASPVWNSGASGSHSDSDAVIYASFSVDAGMGALVSGTNILAIHGLNSGSGSSDFLIQPTLSAILNAAPNSPPSVQLTASAGSVGVNQDVTLSATGSDPNGDPLAYAWDFDIGDIFAPEGLNSPLAIRRWSTAGLYVVTITCSDQKGGIARDRVLIRVGSPANDGIVKGRVLRGGQPVASARVFIDGTNTQSITLDDGSYLLAGLSTSAGVKLSASLDGEVFQSSVAMPVSPAPLLEGVDFHAHTSALPTAPPQALTVSPNIASTDTTSTVQLHARLWDNTMPAGILIPFGDTWKYLDTGSDPGLAWANAAFDDSAWLSSPAELGYGDVQTTTTSYGPDASNKFITTWFRRTFTASNIAQISRLKLSLKRDDGIRVFLNGTEIARDNLTSGTVSASTLARFDVTAAVEDTLLYYSIDPSLLNDGPNIIAAEVHQSASDSADLSFDLELSASQNLSTITPTWSISPSGAAITPAGLFSATNPGTYTVTATSGALSDIATISVASDNLVSIAATDSFLWENGNATSVVRISRSGTTTGALTVPLSIGGAATNGIDFQTLPNSVTIPVGQTFTELVITPLDDSATEGREWIHITPQPNSIYSIVSPALASVAIIDDENLRVPEPNAGADTAVYAGAPLTLQGSLGGTDIFVTAGDYWKYDDRGIAPGSTWTALLFGDSAWREGLAKFGYGDNSETTTVSFGSNSSNKQITTYFRRRFYLSTPGDYTSLKASLLVDDGAVIHINGAEARRVNMPAGAINISTRAVNSISGSDENTFFEWDLDPAGLVTGENIIAVEVHQSSSSSSDLGFDMALRGSITSPPPGATILWEKISGPGNATFSDSESLASSVTFDQPGTYVLRLNAGLSYSDEVTITVNPVPRYAEWIAGFSVSDSNPLADPDKDDWNNLMEYASGTNPASESSNAVPELFRDPNNPTEFLFTYRRLRALDPAHVSGSTGNGYALYGVTYTVEATTVLGNWQPANSILSLSQESTAFDNGDGTETVTVRLIPPANNTARWFARLSVSAD